MIQRLLRGQALYFVLGALIIFLYMRAMRVAPLKPLDASGATPVSQLAGAPPGPQSGGRSADAASADDVLSWWPKTLSREDLERVAAREPLLGIFLSLLTIFIVGMALGGVGLALSSLWSGRVRSVWRYRPRRLPRWSFGELGRIVAWVLILTSAFPLVRLSLPQEAGMKIGAHLWISLSMLILDAGVILIILAFAAGKRGSVWRTLGFSDRQLLPSVMVALRGYVAVFPWLFLLLFFTVEAARHFGWTPPVEPIQELIFEEQNPHVLALTVLLACVIGPIGEELFFRGVLYTAIRQRTSRMVAMLVSATAFSLIHTNVLGFLPILALGCLMADLYERTGSLISPLVVHILHNTFLMSLALVVRRLLWLSE